MEKIRLVELNDMIVAVLHPNWNPNCYDTPFILLLHRCCLFIRKVSVDRRFFYVPVISFDHNSFINLID